MMPSNNNYAAWVYGSLQRNAARFCSTERLASDPNPLRWDVCLWPKSVVREWLRTTPEPPVANVRFRAAKAALANGITAVDW